ncbi:trichohyalin-like isoform X2 [Oxyura jamaicensis]|uniref:trichohyalin-like isoform X2 n=1 Tax=Oxyura jamaicensis TaxID=8884 RepID=UPI0015A56AEF|nr:trichohyalin-like isoform X2 [Oxyura jamaicensis]
MPLAARQLVVESSLDYPYVVTPGYRPSGHRRRGRSPLECWPSGLHSVQACATCSCRCTLLPHCCLAAHEHPQPTEHKVQQEDAFVPGASCATEELSKEIEEQLSEVRISSSESVLREEEKKEEKRLKTDNAPNDAESCLEEDNEVLDPKKSPQREPAHATMVDAAVSTDSWLMEAVRKEEAGSRQQDAETDAHFKHNHGLPESRVAEAPLQPSQRSPSLGTSAVGPFRRQSFFDRVNQSLEKDRLAIESALRVQRPHSTSSAQARRSTNLLHLLKDKSITKSVLNSASQERWEETDLNRAKIEYKRGQEEQRQQKRQEQQEEEALRRQLRRNNQRQRLHQRMLQGLEKQLEHKDRALQHMASLQAAWSERSRKESFLSEEENRKDFLKSRTQSQQQMLKQDSQEQDRKQKQHQAAKRKLFQNRNRSQEKVQKEDQKHCDLQQYLREQNLLMLRASLLA